MTPESKIKAAIFEYLKLKKIFCWNTDSVGIYDPQKKIYRRSFNPNKIRGVSDIVGILPGGRFLAIEVKSAQGRLSPEQKSFLEQIRASGGVAFMARSVDEVAGILKGIYE